MKKYFFIYSTILASNIFAQFNVNGSIKNYNNQPVLVKLLNNGTPKLVKHTNTNNDGNFNIKIPIEYRGIIKIETPSGLSLDLLTDNENLNFKTIYGENIINDLQIIEGNSQKEYKKILELEKLNELNSVVYPEIKKIYKPTDPFYKAMDEEQNRINILNNSVKLDNNLVKYMQQINNLTLDAKNNINDDIANNILQKLQDDDDRLEHSGYLQELILAYINYEFSKNKNANPEDNLTNITEVLLEKGNIETERGQNILSIIFDLVPENNFPNFYAKYKDKVNNLTCKVTDGLKEKVKGNTQVKIGNKVPNIVFDKPINGKKSLYDIKSNQKLIVFWASWCPACNKELPFIKDYYNDFKKKGGEIIAISLDYDKTNYNEAIKELPWINYSDFLRWDSPIATEYGVESTPTLFLLDKDNKLIETVNHISQLK